MMHFDRRFAVVLGASLLWALIVSALFYRLAGGSGGRVRAAGERTVVLASKPLPLGAVIARESVKLGKAPESLVPAGAFSRLEDVLGRPVISVIEPEEPVVEARLAARGSGPGLGPLIPPGMRAIAVRVNDVAGVAGFILPGMRVDVLVTGRPANQNDTWTRTVLQDIPVLSAGQTIQTDGKSQSIMAPVVTLEVTPQEAEALTLAVTEGHIQLVLRNSTDRKIALAEGRQSRDLYGVREAAPAPPPLRRLAVAVREIPQVMGPPVVIPPVMVPPPEADQMILIHGHVRTVTVFGKDGQGK